MIKAKYKLNFLDNIARFFNYLAAVCILISYLAPFSDPQYLWPIAFFGLAYPPFLLVNVLFMIYWCFRFKRYILISAISIAIGWSALLNNIGFHNTTPDVPKAAESQIRLMAYNVHSFLSPQDEKISTRHEILQVIKDQQPDILTIEEYHTRNKGRSAVGDSLKKILNTNYLYYECFNGTPQDGGGLAIISKYPITNTGVIKLTDDDTDTKSIFADVFVNGKTLRIYCVHLQSFRLNGQDHSYVDSAQNGKTSFSGSKRIGGKLKTGFVLRSNQVKMLKQHMALCQYPYLVAGDFNDTPSSYAVNQMAKGLKNAFREKARGMGRTYNGDIPNYQIDYIMASPAFDIVNYTVIEKKPSDHYPIRSDVILR